SDITLEILDSTNNVVNTLSSKPRATIGFDWEIKDEEEAFKKAAIPKEAGVQMASWNLSYAGSEMIPNAMLDWGDPLTGPMVPPGTYTVRLKVDDQSYSTTLKVMPDPRVKMTDAEYREYIGFANSIRDDITRLTRIVNQLRSVRRQLTARNDLLRNEARAAQLVTKSESLIGKLNALEEQLHNPKAEMPYDILAMKGGVKLYSRLSALFNFAMEGDGPPTQGVRETYETRKAELNQLEGQWKELVSKDLPALNDAARKLDVPIVLVK
ncbi:MAG TPA: hypothetical protein VJ521_10660, partial [Acidobacteriota bacterium]|nr:hypothetical protein [Acidobacteriota bacterium]